MDTFIKQRLLEKIKKRLELVLPNFIFDIILKMFRKFKLVLNLVIPKFVRQIISKVQRRIMCGYVNFKYRNYSVEKLAQLYDKDYHQTYINNSDEIEIKKWQAIAIQRALPNCRKVLIAGCSGGELIRALKKIGIEAYGFDVSPDLDKIVIDEVRLYIRQGSILNIPFFTSDKFDTFIAIDVFEHIPIGQIDNMIKEIARINVKYIVTVINYFDYKHIGHITMKSLLWWQKKFRNYYQIDKNIDFSKDDIPSLYSLNNDPVYKFIFWRRVKT